MRISNASMFSAGFVVIALGAIALLSMFRGWFFPLPLSPPNLPYQTNIWVVIGVNVAYSAWPVAAIMAGGVLVLVGVIREWRGLE